MLPLAADVLWDGRASAAAGGKPLEQTLETALSRDEDYIRHASFKKHTEKQFKNSTDDDTR